MKRFLLLFSLLLIGKIAVSQEIISSVEQEDDLLILSNDHTKVIYKWLNGNLILLSFENKSLDITEKWPNNTEPMLWLDDSLKSIRPATLHSGIKRLSPMDPSYLEVTVTQFYEGFQVRQVLELFDGSGLITHHIWLKLDSGDSYLDNALMARVDHGMIEQATLSTGQAHRMGYFPITERHWKVSITRFEEATDHHNNLVQSDEILTYRKALPLRGNILVARSPNKNLSYLLAKLSPLDWSQQTYPGYDFIVDQESITVNGLGLSNEVEEGWQRGYGFAYGIFGSNELDMLLGLHRYQFQKRSLRPDRDEMVLANTWGDRSKDSRMNEGFVLEEISLAAKLGITHLQLDDGWQAGSSRNSASRKGTKWDDWTTDDWKPHEQRFPQGLDPIINRANQEGINICLWFNPSKESDYEKWERDAEILSMYYTKHEINTFKIDGVSLSSKVAEIRLRNLFDHVLEETEGKAVFNMDVTAGSRMGYWYFGEYGNIFLENRYTDWANYYPYQTLRNLWMLSKYVAPQRIQVEFLNKWRNQEKYPLTDRYQPYSIPFEYIMATTFAGQPLAWMELSGLPGKGLEAASLLRHYVSIQSAFHNGIILPIGNEPDGKSWTGFQSIVSDKEGYFLVYREQHPIHHQELKVRLAIGKSYELIPLFGERNTTTSEIGPDGKLVFDLPSPWSFGFYKYRLKE